MTNFIARSLQGIGIVSVWLLIGCATTPPPAVSGGLHLVVAQPFDEVYLRPDVSLAQYTAIRLQPCTVAFKANWLRNQNSNRALGRARISNKDMQKISDRLAGSCDEHFKKALARPPAYKIIADGENADSETVLELRPSLVEVDLTAPDINEPGITRSYTMSSGEMTLLLEAYDGASGEVIARVTDTKEDFNNMQLEPTNRATNMADTNRYLRSWTRALRQSLDAARAQ
ncbi:DUF3313 family protein [Gilvimarinus polysaccharolyticus]|uniref:DUF3313 family protein n=1 Tax=Gilvimarinus polysaccharolyticus TaxID=863921 RepID=UPI0006739766|nr:DUF3313 family protein [Gilvimarinus polysaccharolyticus]